MAKQPSIIYVPCDLRLELFHRFNEILDDVRKIIFDEIVLVAQPAAGDWLKS